VAARKKKCVNRWFLFYFLSDLTISWCRYLWVFIWGAGGGMLSPGLPEMIFFFFLNGFRPFVGFFLKLYLHAFSLLRCNYYVSVHNLLVSPLHLFIFYFCPTSDLGAPPPPWIYHTGPDRTISFAKMLFSMLYHIIVFSGFVLISTTSSRIQKPDQRLARVVLRARSVASLSSTNMFCVDM
jgi:hypothetical protein